MNKFLLPFLFAGLGFIFTTKKWIKFMDKNNPFIGLLIYYIILTITILILEYFGLIIAGIQFANFSQTIGTILIIFSFFIIFNFESCYINLVSRGNCNLSNVYLQSEDGAIYYLWSKLFKNQQLLRFLTYVLTPFIFTFIGIYLITEKITITPF